MRLLNRKLLVLVILASSAAIAPAWSQEAGKSTAEWTKINSSIRSLEERIRTSQETLQKLIRLKASAKTKEQKGQAIDAMLEEHENYRSLMSDYNSLRKERKYRFPGKGEVSDRSYLPLREQSLEEMEQEMGISPSLTRFKKKMEAKYRPILKSQKASGDRVTSSDEPSLVEAPEEDRDRFKKLRLEK